MGRRPHIVVPGATKHGWAVVSADGQGYKHNRQVLVRHLTCGTTRLAWASSFSTGSISCQVCSGRYSKMFSSLLERRVILAVFDDYIEIYQGDDEVPAHATKLFKLLNPTRAEPYILGTADAPVTDPGPDKGYFHYLKVPSDYADYLCSISDLPPGAAEAANAYFDERVVTPTPTSYSNLVRGSAQTWSDLEGTWTYIYWKDQNTWPKAPPSPETAPPSDFSTEPDPTP